MMDTKLYRCDDLDFEFTPNGSPYQGLLKVILESGDAFSSDLTLSKLRSRAQYAKEVAELYEIDVIRLKRALNELSTLRDEEVRAAQEAAEEEPQEEEEPLDQKRLARARKLLRRSDLLGEVQKDLKRLGLVGQERAVRLAFLCGISARFGKPVQPVTKAQSGAGKNYLWDMLLSLFPTEDVIKRTGLSAKALFRTDEDLANKILYVQEVVGSEDADYTIRALQSDGGLEYEATEKGPDGQLRNVVYRKEGPATVIQTTTKTHLHPENETRVFGIYVDESEEQTALINRNLLDEAAGKGVKEVVKEAIRQKWQDAIRLLGKNEKVVIPFARRIRIPNTPVRIRRDARRLMDVIKVVAYLHQYSRERDELGRIIATEDDFHIALELVTESLMRAWKALTPGEEKVLQAVDQLSEEKRTKGFKRRDLNVRGFSVKWVNELLSSLSQSGHLECKGSQHTGYTYTDARKGDGGGVGIYLDPDFQPPTGPKKGTFAGKKSEKSRTSNDPQHFQRDPEEGSENQTPPGQDEAITWLDELEAEEDVLEVVGSGESSPDFQQESHDLQEEPDSWNAGIEIVTPPYPHVEEESGEAEEATSLEKFLVDPPEWFRRQAAFILRDYPDLPDRVLKSISSSVAVEVFEDWSHWDKAYGLVKAKLEEMRDGQAGLSDAAERCIHDVIGGCWLCRKRE